MKFISSIKSRLKSYRSDVSDNGFSFLEIVITVGLMLILSVGGYLTYSGITQNAKEGAVEAAASQVYSAAVAYDLSGDKDPVEAANEYNKSQDGSSGKKINVTVTPATETVGISVKATNADDETITASRGDVAPVTPGAGE